MNSKKLFEKMSDYKRFAVILLAVGSFFYLGVIIPAEKPLLDLYIMMMASGVMLFVSILFFILSKRCKKLLLEHEDGQNYLNKH